MDAAYAGGKDALLNWINSFMLDYGVVVKNFQRSFQDPRVFGGMLNKLKPFSVDVTTMTDELAVETIDRCIEEAEKALGCDEDEDEDEDDDDG
jgi:hypothetical protein